MRIVEQGHEVVRPLRSEWPELLARIERAGRTCYKSEDRITHGSAERFVRMLLERGHESVIEHESMTVRFVCDRGVSHELVRHRLASFSQESTRYCCYAHAGELCFIRQPFWEDGSKRWDLWHNALRIAEATYLALIDGGAKPEEARSVLPNSLKTEIVVTANIREWRHIFKLRCSPKAHPQMRQMMAPLLSEVVGMCPALFADLQVE